MEHNLKLLVILIIKDHYGTTIPELIISQDYEVDFLQLLFIKYSEVSKSKIIWLLEKKLKWTNK